MSLLTDFNGTYHCYSAIYDGSEGSGRGGGVWVGMAPGSASAGGVSVLLTPTDTNRCTLRSAQHVELGITNIECSI